MSKSVTASCLIVISLASAVHCLDGKSGDAGKAAEVRAVEFLKREVPAWSQNSGCFSCHNNGDAARALYKASQKGHQIPADVLADTTAWLATPEFWDKNKGDPGFSDQRLANLQFALALLAALETGHLNDQKPLQVAAEKVAADQDPSGAWLVDVGGALGSPATYGSALATTLAWQLLKASGQGKHGKAAASAERWLSQATIRSVSAAAAFLLAATNNPGPSSKRRQDECLKVLWGAQTQDGGWGPYADSPPEVFDTAIVLLGLAATEKSEHVISRIRRGRNFLAAQQNPDGGWPATTRPSGGESYAQRLSTTGWATLALLATGQ
jgi:Squalene-hopene cyclase C-terminal domain